MRADRWNVAAVELTGIVLVSGLAVALALATAVFAFGA
jgi:hypothetical protein